MTISKTKLFVLVVGITVFTACKKDDDVSPDEVIDTSAIIEIPDTSFKKVLVKNELINVNGDDEISEQEAENFTGNINGPNSEIVSVEGIEYFKNVTVISLYSNSIEQIDLSNNTKVTQLLLEDNKLTNLDVSMLSSLVDLKVHSNELETLNISNGNNANMTRMEAHNTNEHTCVQVDSTDVPENWLIDEKSYYTTNCSLR